MSSVGKPGDFGAVLGERIAPLCPFLLEHVALCQAPWVTEEGTHPTAGAPEQFAELHVAGPPSGTTQMSPSDSPCTPAHS